MAYSFRKTQPKYAGVLVKEGVQCGKQTCHCMKGKLHRWYWYLYWRDYGQGGMLKKIYIPKGEVRKLRAHIKRMKMKDREEKRTFLNNLTMLKQLLRDTHL